MGYTRTNHQNALMKLLKEKEMILQIEAARRFNMKSSSSLNSTIKKLEQEGKLKRTKVKIRCKNGNLNDAWLLYLPNIDYNKVLDYEKELVNQPFESPLKEHHCYKKIKNDDNKLIPLTQYIKINNYDMPIIEYNGQRVVSFKEIDQVHQRPEGTAKRNFSANKSRFILNEDYYEVTGEDLNQVRKTYSVHRNTTKLILLTESGYLMLAKTFTDDLSWEVQRQLVNSYFKVKELKQDQEINHLPQIQNIQIFDVMEMMIQQMRQQNERIDKLENKINAIAQVLSK
jgi:DNA-binding Lrp family transcriptional regulator